ncbi:hypothetical protein TPA0909_55620 [Streptomyces albus]|nr:hypothetical protein TPA0909_55620 [Streptomyces albus]
MSEAASGSRPIITNSAVPAPNVAMAKARRARGNGTSLQEWGVGEGFPARDGEPFLAMKRAAIPDSSKRLPDKAAHNRIAVFLRTPPEIKAVGLRHHRRAVVRELSPRRVANDRAAPRTGCESLR